MLCRCLVLNQSYEFLDVASWFDAICLVIEGKASPLAEYDDVARSQYNAWRVPSVLVMKEYVQTTKKRSSFNVVSKRNLLVRDGFKCSYCESKLSMRSATVDHIIPRSKGGLNTLDNTVASCKTCNNLKGDMSLSKFTSDYGMVLNTTPRSLTDEEKVDCLIKTVKSKERNAWVACLKEHNISLY